MPLRISREKAQTSGLVRFFTGKPCAKGHVAEQYTSNRWCVICSAISKKDWHNKQPKDRKREYDKQWVADNPERHRATKQRHLRKLKLDVLKIYGNECKCCGETEPLFLTIDHVDNDGKTHRKEIVGQAFYRHLRDLSKPDKRYQILCFNCNIAKSLFGVCPHQRKGGKFVCS